MSNATKMKFDGTKHSRIGSWLLVLLMVVATGIVHAAPVDKELATKFAENWLKAAGNALNTEVGAAEVGDIEEFKNADGKVLGYIVSLEPKGFIVVSADDRINPVVIVSKEGKFDSNPQNPLFALLYADLTNRMTAVEKIAADQTRGELPEGIQQNKATWARFTTGGTRAAGVGVVSEVWVGSFVESRWSQSGGIYNYYTPTIYDKSYSFDEPGNQNNAPCGCVATGTAQILRYFQWPQKPIGVKTGRCSIETDNGTQFSVSMNLRGGDGTGGAYDWDAMTLVPTGAEKLETYKQIGALCFDAGLAVGMSYSSSASGSNYSPRAMKDFFGYADAARSLNANDARANLDARRPVGVSISSIIPDLLGGEGHAIVCDGYGRLDGRWYYHMNYGWAGAADAWYNCEEVFATTWAPSFGFALGNLYRQKLQANDNLAGQIISGRVTDANGNPVAGVKVSIRKAGSEDTWQTMLVWNEPKDPEATPIYQDWDEKGNNNGTQEADEIPGADKFRNTTDARGIWAIDKVEAGTYEIVLEKDGLNFAGTKTVTVPNNRNVWANDFVASPLENLALLSWWKEGTTAYLQFNRAVGNVDVDLSKATIGGTSLAAGEAQVIASSDIIAITGVSASGSLSLEAGFLTVDVDGSNTTDQTGMYDVKPVVVLDAVDGVAAGSAAAASKVTKIALKKDALTKDNLLYFQVTGNGLTDADLNSFKIRNITTGKVGTQVPNVSIYSWTPSTGELVVRAYNGEAYIGVDYVPETGTAYLSSELYTFDDCGPAIIAATLSKDNKYVTVTWNEPVFGWTKKVQATDLNVILHNNGGTITNAQVESVTLLDADAEGYATKMNVFIKYNPSLEVQYNAAAVTASGKLPYTALNDANWTVDDDTIAAYRVPAGVETIEVVPRENKVFDVLKNASATSNTTGDLILFDSKNPRLVSAIMSNDNYSIQLTFNKRIFGKSGLASPLLQVAAVLGGAANTTDFLNTGNFTAVVNYSGGAKETLGLHNNGIYYTLGTNYIYLDFNHYNGPAADNRKKLDPAYNAAAMGGRVPQSITLTLKNIVDKDENPLKDTTITIPLWTAYKPGKTSLLPPMFTNAKDSYTYIEQPNNQVLVTKAGTNNPDNYLYTPYGKGQSGVDPASDGLIYYGIYYRDLDGDGRIDAIDLNYHNPDYNNGNNPAQLYAGGSAASNFRVWVQNNDPDDIDDDEKSFYPADSEGVNWNSFPQIANYPLGNGTADNSIYNFRNNWGGYTNFAKNWICLTPSSVEVVSQNLIKSGNSNNERYSTLRLYIDQTKVRARTYGTRYVMVAYTSPRDVTSYGGNGNANGKYNKYMVAGAKAPTNDTYGSNYVRYNDSDETAGVYWRRNYTGGRSDANGTNGYMDNYHIADGFGPVVAWDGAAPVPVSAIAWRATPYVKKGESNMDGYEYLDITFTEPIAYAADKAMSSCGYTNDAKTGATSADGYLHGCWGAEVISANTVRFKVNGLKTDKTFSFNGALFGMTPGFFESYSDAGTRNPRSLSFSVNAVGVKPADSRYKVISQGTAVDMFTVDAANASITSYNSSFTQSVNQVELKGVEQGGDWRSTAANWLYNGTSIANVGTSYRHQPGNVTTTMTYSMRSNNLSNSVAPGSSVYGVISSLIIRNNTFDGYVKGGNAAVHCPAALNTFYAPDPLGRYMAFASVNTPVKSAMSGPVYNMVKVGAITQTSGTSRIVAGKTISVLGIDAAGSSAHKLTAITVRAIDTSMGQFDPSIDLEPLADGATSGLQLCDASGNVIKVANNGDEWSEWKVNEAGQPYKEVTLRPLTPVTLPTAGGDANSYDFQIRVITSASFNLGDSFVIEIPDDGIAFGSYKTVDNRPATWGTPNGAPGFPFTDYYYKDNNNDGRWAEGDSIASKEDTYTTIPLYDGGKPYTTDSNNRPFLSENGVNVKNLYYAKKNWATNPESSPFYSTGNVTPFDKYSSMMGGINFVGPNKDLNYNVSYAPGDDVWYDIGGEPGVYDEGIDIPLFGNADAFPLSWQVAECGAKSAQYRAAATATAGSASTGFISAPSNGPVATVGLDMRDAGRGFGPRFILDDSILVESISKNVAGGEYTIVLKNGKLIWNNGAEFDIPADNGRAVIDDGNGTFIVVRKLADAPVPTADTTVNFTVSSDAELDIQQPSTITGVRITALGRGNVANTKGTLKRNGTKLSWNGGAEVDVANGGFFFLNGDKEDYLVVQVSQVGGGSSDELAIYSADGRSITPFLNITGLEIMTVSDMVPQGYYTFSYDGAGSLSWGNGAPAKVNVAEGEFVIVEGNGTNLEHAQNFVVVRRTNGPLPAQGCTDTLFINQSQLLRVAVTVTGVNGFSITHLADLTNDENSGVSLWWDANADGTFNTGDKFVKLLETPEFSTNGDAYSTVLTPDPQFITSWLSCSQSVSDTSFNFFVCVNTTEDMSYGDSFNVSASFYEPTEPNYTTGGNYFASANSGNIVCTSITNTVFRKLTTKGQTIDANTTIRLAGINHFFGTAIGGKQVYMTAVTVTIVAPEGSTFHPDTAFTPMDASSAANRGIQLVAANGNVIPCAIELITDNPEKGPWTYVLRPEASAGDSLVPQAQDDVDDHIIVVKLASTLPYGVSFYARMETDAVVYNTGNGSAAAAMVTDILGSTINSDYADLLDSSMVTPTSGLVVNNIGTGVASAYHDIKIGYNVGTNTYSLTWNGNTVGIDATQPGTYILGSGTNSITVTFDPAAFFMEDTLVTSESGRPDEDITIGTKLTNLAGQGLAYYDANANGQYDLYEPIAYNGELIYGDGDAALCVVEFTAASGLSFWDKDGDGTYAKGDSIFHDTDNEYTLPWMALLVDSDNYITAGQGGAAAGVSVGTGFVDAASVSPDFGKLAKGIYLYYVDMVADGRGYVYGEDIVIARTVTANGTATAAALQKNASLAYYDKVVYDPAFDTDDYEEIAAGDLNCFQKMDYVKFRQGGNDSAAFEQGDAIFLSVADTFASPDFTWTIRVNKDRRIRWYSETAPAPYNQALKSITAIAGLDIASSGATDVVLTSLTVRFVSVKNFTMDDLRALTVDENSGVQLWRDLDGNGIFNPDIDKLVKLSSAPTLSSDGTNYIVKFSPSADNEITNADVDGIYDYFVVVQPSITANNKQKTNDGDQFRIIINNGDVVLNKTLNKSASLTSGTITIDSRFPALASAPVITDADSDGYIDSVKLVFDEALRPGMLDDVSIWQLRDYTSGNALTVTKAELSSDYKTVTLTLSDADIGTTTGKVAVVVVYDGSESALLDWAGNAVDFRIDATRPESADDYTNYTATSDTVAPQIVHTGMKIASADYDEATVVKADNLYFHDRNANGKWDAGEDIWAGEATYKCDIKTRIWNGGDNAWTTDLGYNGVKLENAYFCDANGDGAWNGFEFLWIDAADEDEGVYVEGNDTIVPLYRTEEIDVFDKDHNGYVDALRVYFSENVNDSTMTGYVGTTDSYTASKWSVTGNRTLTAWRLGLKDEDVTDINLRSKVVKDIINNNSMYFTFAENTAAYSTDCAITLSVAAGETLKDVNGNALNGGKAYNGIAVNDRAKPILLAAESDTRVNADGVLAEGSKLTLTFSEPMAIYYAGDDIVAALADVLIFKNEAWMTFDATLAKTVEVSADDASKIVITMAESAGWSYKTAAVKVRDDIDTYTEDTVFGDVAGNNLAINANLAVCPVTGLVYKDAPVIEIPIAYNVEDDNILRADDLKVKVFFGSYGYFRSEKVFANAFQVTEWALTVSHNGAVVSQKIFTDEDSITNMDKIEKGFLVFTDREWLFEGGFKVLDYILSLDLTAVDPDTNEPFNVHTEVAFKAQADICADYTDIGDGKVVSADDGLVLNKVGENVANGYYDVTLKLADGVYTLEWNGNSVVIEDIKKVTTVTLGDEANRIQVTLNPNVFSAELNEKIEAGEDFSTSWTILVDQDRKINVFNSKAPVPYNVIGKALSAVAGLDIANSGEENVGLESVTVHFVSENDFDMNVLCALSTGDASGVQLWRDANGNSIFDENDSMVALSSATFEDEGEGSYKVVLTLAAADPIVNSTVDGLYDYYIVVLPKEAEEKTNEGPQFKVVIKQGEIILTNKEIKHTELVSEPFMIDSKAPALVESSIADTDGDGYLETVELTFDEQLRRDAVDDIAIWQLKDASNGKALTVVEAAMDDTCTKVTLTLAGNDLGTTTGAVSLMVDYNDVNALLDWAGNVVDFRTDETKAEGDYVNYITSADTAAPVVLNEGISTGEDFRSEIIAVLDSNNNGHIDAIDVFFSEAIDPATLENAAWTLEGYGTLVAEADAENASHVRFTFAESEAYDTDATPALTIDSAITDLAGNAVIAPQGLKLNDKASPVLVYAKAEGGKIADDTMPEGVTVTLTFSEPVKQNLFTDEESTVDQIMSDFQIRRNGQAWEDITTDLVSAVAVEDGKIVLTMVGETTGWGLGTSIDIKVKDAIADTTVFGDEAGNNIAANTVALYPYEDANVAFIHTLIEFKDAAILNPNDTNNYLRTNGLPVQMLLNSACVGNAFQIESWTFTVEHDGEATAATEVPINAASAAALTQDGGMEVFTDTAWQVEEGAAPAIYTLKVSFTWIDPDDANAETNAHSVEYATTFTALANNGVEPMTVRDGMNFGENIAEVQKNASNVWSNWAWGETNITNNNLLIKSYKSYYIDEEGAIVSATAETAEAGNGEYVAKMRLTGALEVGKTYIAVVEAYDGATMIGKGVSDGVTVVEAFDDVESMEFTDGTDLKVDNTDEKYNLAVRTDSHDTLYAKWTQVSDSLTAKENMRYKYRVVSQFGSSQWSVDAGAMNQPRQYFGSAVLGDKLYAIGGYQDVVLKSVEVYDLNTRKWSEVASLKEARRDFACVTLNGKIYAIGGTGEGDVPLTSIEEFNGSSWSKLPVTLPEPYENVKAVKVDETHIWIIGAIWYKDETRQSVLKTEIRKFDIATGVFSNEVIAAPAITARYGDFQVVLQRRADGSNLVIADGLDADYGICRKVDVVDIATGAVSTVELTDSRWGCALIAVPSAEDASVDNVWFIGGMDDYFNYLNTVDQLDTTGAIASLDGQLNIGRAGASVYWNEDLNNVIIVGGFTSDHAWKNIPEIAANDGETWVQCPGTAMNVSRIGQHLEVVGADLNSKRMVLFGGTDQANSYIAETESCIWIEALEASEWMVTDDDVTKVKVEGLDLKEGASYVFEVKAVDEQGYESAAARSAGIYISSSSISLELVPAPVANAAEGQVYQLKVTAKNDGNTLRYYHYKVTRGEEVIDYSAESIDITTATTMIPFVCAEGENESTFVITVWSAIDALISETTSVTVAKATYTVDSVDPLDVDSYTLGVELNGLVAYEWQLDDGDVSDVTTDAEFTVTGLTVGSHTVSLWGIDANGVRQSDATTITLFYKTPDIVGDVLTGVITAADAQSSADGETIAYTLTMSEAIVNDPVAANFTVENGIIESIEDVDGNKTTYTITVRPDGDGIVSIVLKANTLFTADKGIPNTASEAGKTLYFTKAALTFTPAVDTDEEDYVAYVGETVAINVNFESDYVLLGGDLGIMFDSDVFAIADLTKDGDPDATKMLKADYQKDGYVASWIKDGDKIVGIRLGGANGKATATSGIYATITFYVLKEVTEGSAITLQALENTDEYAGIALPGLHLQGEMLAAVEYGEVVVATALRRPVLALTAAETTVAEGNVELTIGLGYALDSDVVVDFIENGEVLSTETIKAGKTAVTVTLDKADNFLTGDRVFTYAIACTDDAVILDDTAVVINVIDDDTAITLTREADAINEGDQMVITFALAEGITAAADVTFNSPLIPTTDPDTFTSGIDFRMDAEPVIAAGENSGTITIKTYIDNAINGDYDITVTLTEMNVGGNECSAFDPASISFIVKDSDYKRGDFDGNNIVDYDDVIAFLSKMGATVADADWAENKMYDLDNDGDVDYDDLIELLSLMEFDGRRGGASTRGDKVIRLWLESDKQIVAPGDIINVKLMAENMTGQGLSAFKCNVNFNAADLAYNGEFDPEEVVNSAFNSIRDGSLADNGIAELIGTFAKRNVMSGIAIDGEPFELATLSLVVKATAAGNINIDLSNLNASTQAATRAGTSVLDGTLEVVTESLTIAVDGGAAVVPEFDIEFAAHQQTRASNVALKVGMAENASFAFNAAEGDETLFPAFDKVYDVRVIDGRRAEDLCKDIRGLANRETWSVQVTVGEGQALTLDWSEAELPEYFDFTIVKGKYYNDTEVIDMREKKSLAFAEGETFITIVADKKASEDGVVNYTFKLTPGWNLIGIPFEMDAASLSAFAGKVGAVFTFDDENQSYIPYEEDLVVGGSYWVYVAEATDITVSGSRIEADGVTLKAGWNWVTPLKNSVLSMPEGTDKAVWFYTADGYRQATEDADIQLGRGYWVYSAEDIVIWQTK
ncbi:MAG: C10 family peptidase [Victivallales bacterium]|nr:C10 family peptidase [Victivallales bacterium]